MTHSPEYRLACAMSQRSAILAKWEGGAEFPPQESDEGKDLERLDREIAELEHICFDEPPRVPDNPEEKERLDRLASVKANRNALLESYKDGREIARADKWRLKTLDDLIRVMEAQAILKHTPRCPICKHESAFDEVCGTCADDPDLVIAYVSEQREKGVPV